jgi:hypothetical protein
MTTTNLITLPNPEECFYGFRLDSTSGRLTLDMISDGSVISLDRYTVFFWSTQCIHFSFSITNAHLQATIL